MKYNVEVVMNFDRSNAAFEDNQDGQIDAIIMRLKQTLSIGMDYSKDTKSPLFDQNGNRIGAVAVNFSS